MPQHIKESVFDFFGYTTLHGLGRLAFSKLLPQKVFWALAFLGSAAMCFYQVSRLAQQFTSEQTTTKIEIEYGEMRFPEVTICNMNPLLFSKVQKTKDLYQIIDETANLTGLNMEYFVDDTPPQYNYSTVIDWPTSLSLDDVKEFFFAKMGISDISSLTPDPKKFILSCTFNGKDCEASNFTQVRDEYYGFCYEFTPEVEMNINVAGNKYGLNLLLDVQENEYLPFISDSVGVVFDVKSPGAIPTPKSTGVAVPTGFHTSCSLSVHDTLRLPGRNQKCSEEKKTYNDKAHCIEKCLGEKSATTCNCAHEYSYTTADINMCESFGGLTCNKAARLELQKDIDVHCPHCSDPCRTTDFTAAMSMKKWPSRPSQEILEKLMKNDGINVTAETMETSMLRLSIYFSSLTREKIIEETAYTEENFVSDIGGQLGLWIGMSVLSLAEMFELVAILFAGICKKRNENQKVDNDP